MIFLDTIFVEVRLSVSPHLGSGRMGQLVKLMICSILGTPSYEPGALEAEVEAHAFKLPDVADLGFRVSSRLFSPPNLLSSNFSKRHH